MLGTRRRHAESTVRTGFAWTESSTMRVSIRETIGPVADVGKLASETATPETQASIGSQLSHQHRAQCRERCAIYRCGKGTRSARYRPLTRLPAPSPRSRHRHRRSAAHGVRGTGPALPVEAVVGQSGHGERRRALEGSGRPARLPRMGPTPLKNQPLTLVRRCSGGLARGAETFEGLDHHG